MCRRFQFSLRGLMVVPAVAGVVAITFWGEHHLAMRLTPFLVCGVAATMVANGNRHARAFGAASILPFGISAVLAIKSFFDIPSDFLFQATMGTVVDAIFDDSFPMHYQFRVAFLWSAGSISGAIAVALTSLFGRNQT